MNLKPSDTACIRARLIEELAPEHGTEVAQEAFEAILEILGEIKSSDETDDDQ